MSDDRGVVFGDATGGVLAAFFRAFGAGGDWKSPRSGFFAFFAGGAEGGGASSSGRSAFFFDEDVFMGTEELDPTMPLGDHCWIIDLFNICSPWTGDQVLASEH